MRVGSFLRGDNKISAWGIHAGKSRKSYLVSYRAITPDPEPTAALGKVKKQRQGKGKCNYNAGRKSFFGGRGGRGHRGHKLPSPHSQTN